jgi:hypothetical protein
MNSAAAALRIELETIDALPDAAIPHGSALRDAFLQRGLTTFHGACGWVKRLPYGPNPEGDHGLALFADDFIVRVPPALRRDDLQRLYAEHLKLYAPIHPRLAELETSAVQKLVRECAEVLTERRLEASV